MKKKLVFFLVFLFILLFSKGEEKKMAELSQSVVKEEIPVFSCSSIPEEVKTQMDGKSMPQDAKITYEELAYVVVSYYGFDGKIKTGELIVNKKLQEEVKDIFEELYENQYPIEKIKLIDEYDAQDEESMKDNNTSAFCYRVVAGTTKLSNHAKGCAIDINPLQNPQVKNGIAYPTISQEYVNRNQNKKGMIKKGDIVYQIFIKRGWTWGGEWKNPDYQHFEKSLV